MPKPVAWRAGADERRKFRKNNFLAEVSEEGGALRFGTFRPAVGHEVASEVFLHF